METTYIIILTSGERKTTLEPKKVMNPSAVETSNHGQVATARTAQSVWPRTILKYLGKSPVKSEPTGTALAARFVATTASD